MDGYLVLQNLSVDGSPPPPQKKGARPLSLEFRGSGRKRAEEGSEEDEWGGLRGRWMERTWRRVKRIGVKLSLHRGSVHETCTTHESRDHKTRGLRSDWWLSHLYSELRGCPCSHTNDPKEGGRRALCPEDPKWKN